jgi:hypothetical protein
MHAQTAAQIQIEQAVVNATTGCTKGFMCLSGHTDCMCWPAYASRYPFVEIKPKSIEPCSYLLRYGTTACCLCPTRNAIYHRYRV